MTILLRLTEFLCGEAARDRVLEPLVADWQRELDLAKRRSGLSYALAIVSGSLALLRALLACAVYEGVWIPPLRGSILSLAAVAVAISVSIAVLLIRPMPMDLPRDLSEPLVQRWVLIWAGVIVPPAFLLATFLLRRDARATIRHAVIVALLAGVAAGIMVVSTTDDALRRRYDTFAVSERMRERDIAARRAGRIRYDGGRYERELRTTVAERRARFDRFHAQLAELTKNDPPPTLSDYFALLQPVLMSILFAVMGWTLAGLGALTISRGAGWWALMFSAIIAMTRILSNLVGVPMPRPPSWVLLPLFSVVTLSLVIGARQMRKPQLR